MSKDKKPKNYYFSDETQEAINEFVTKRDDMDKDESDELFDTKIRPALSKLVENLIFIYGINIVNEDFNSLKHDCVVFLYENLHKFDPSKGSKAFSYFNIVAKNWLILRAKQSTRHVKRTVLYNDRNNSEELTKFNFLQQTVDDAEHNALQNEFFALLVDEVAIWKVKTKNDKERIVIDAIHQLFKNIDNINIYDKKAVFLYLKELTGMNTKQLCVSINKVKKRYRKYKSKYNSGQL